MKINSTSPISNFSKNSVDTAFSIVAKFLALIGGLILLSMVFVNIISIFGRVFLEMPLVGDFELIEIACGVCIFMFLPICKVKNGNILVDFFTIQLSQKKQIFLDIIGDALFGLVALFFSYRMIFGLLDMLRYNEETMLLEIPVWIPFGPAIFSLFFLSLICVNSILTKLSILINESKN